MNNYQSLMYTMDLEKSLRNYFLYIEKINSKWEELIQAVSRPLQSLKNQSEQLRHVSSPDVDNAEICNFHNAREKLIFKINMGVEDEMSTIAQTIRNLNDLYQELKNKLYHVEKAQSKILDDDPMISDLRKGSIYKPPLNTQLEWTIQIHEYYQDHLNDIKNSFKALDKSDEHTMEKLASSFAMDPIKRAKINEILAFTQYLSNTR